MMLESAKLILVVGAGLVAGVLLNQDLHWVESASGWILFLLLFYLYSTAKLWFIAQTDLAK